MKMALKFKLSLLPAITLLLCSYSLLAQEENFSTQEMQELKQHPELNLEDDKTLFMESDSKQSKMPSSSLKDNNSANQAKPKAEVNKSQAKDKNEEDALNFNFLYYIIQRFKISDIVDD